MAERTINMTAVTENVDPTSVLSETPNVVTATAMDRTAIAFLLENILGDISGTDFIVKFTMGVTSSLSEANAVHMTALMKNHVLGQDWFADIFDINETHYIQSVDSGANSLLNFGEIENVGAGPVLLGNDTAVLTGDTIYYYEWTKVGAVATLDAWTDSGKGTHVSGFPAVLVLTNNSEMPNLFPISGVKDNFANSDSYRTVGPMTIDFGGGVVVKISPLIFGEVL